MNGVLNVTLRGRQPVALRSPDSGVSRLALGFTRSLPGHCHGQCNTYFLCYAQNMVVSIDLSNGWSDREVEGPRRRLRDVPDGAFCTLECGCLVRKMTIAPRAWDMVNIWIHVPCLGFADRSSGKTGRAWCFANHPIRKLAGGVLSTNLPSFTSVTFDPLVSELAKNFP